MKIIAPLFTVFLTLCGVPFANALEIVEPVEGQRIEAGRTTRIVVKPGPHEEWSKVAVGFDPLVYDATVGGFVLYADVPKDVPLGSNLLLVTAISSTHQKVKLNRTVIFTLPSNVSLKSIEVSKKTLFIYKVPAEITVTNRAAWESKKLKVYGLYSDGISRSLSSATAGTTYIISNPDIASVDSSGLVTAKGLGSTKVTIKNGIHSADVNVDVSAYPNK